LNEAIWASFTLTGRAGGVVAVEPPGAARVVPGLAVVPRPALVPTGPAAVVASTVVVDASVDDELFADVVVLPARWSKLASSPLPQAAATKANSTRTIDARRIP
jgi:hypothetical protein